MIAFSIAHLCSPNLPPELLFSDHAPAFSDHDSAIMPHFSFVWLTIHAGDNFIVRELAC